MSKICNKMVEVDCGVELNEKDLCTRLLTILKNMEKNYCVGMTEASNEWLYSTFRDTFLDISELQRELYRLMFRRGWYVMESVNDTKLSDKSDTLNSEYEGLEK